MSETTVNKYGTNLSHVEISSSRNLEGLNSNWQKDKFQKVEWRPKRPGTFGHITNMDQLREVFYRNRQQLPGFEQFYDTAPFPTLEQTGVDMSHADQMYEDLMKAKHQGKKVIAFGDNDIDGATSTFMTYVLLREMGFESPKVFIPNRFDEGFGFRPYYGQVLGERADIIITHDCGAVEKEGIDQARSQGAQVYVIDHHSKHEDKTSNDTPMLHTEATTATGIAYLNALYMADKAGIELPGWLRQVAGLAIRGDMANVTALNHAIEKHSFNDIRANPAPILQSLVYRQEELSVLNDYTLDYTIIPALNAPGRYGRDTAFRLFRAAYEAGKGVDGAKMAARKYLDEVKMLKKKAKAQTDALLESLHLDQTDNPDLKFFWHVFDEDQLVERWADGTILDGKGLIQPLSNRVKGILNKPVYLGSAHTQRRTKDGLITTEGRYPMGTTESGPFLDQIKGYTWGNLYGGHDRAFGFTFYQRNLPEVYSIAHDYTQETVQGFPTEKKEIDSSTTLPFLMDEVLPWQRAQHPFGFRRDRPAFLVRGLTVSSVPEDNEKILKFSLSDGERNIPVIMFGASVTQKRVRRNERIDINCSVDLNTFGGVYPQLVLHDFRSEQRESIKLESRAPQPIPVPELIFKKPSETEVVIPPKLEESFYLGLNDRGHDVDDNLIRENVDSVSDRAAGFAAFRLSGDEYFRKAYAHTLPGSRQQAEYHERIAEVSARYLGDPQVIALLAAEHPYATQTNDLRYERYLEPLGFSTVKEMVGWMKKHFVVGGEFMARRLDEWDFINEGVIENLNTVWEKGKDATNALISNSPVDNLKDVELLLRLHGLTQPLDYFISCSGLGYEKPHPYAGRNWIQRVREQNPHKRHFNYDGNSVDDVLFAANITNIKDFPSDHGMDWSEVVVTPVLITQGRPFDGINVPLCVRFDSFPTYNKVVNDYYASL